MKGKVLILILTTIFLTAGCGIERAAHPGNRPTGGPETSPTPIVSSTPSNGNGNDSGETGRKSHPPSPTSTAPSPGATTIPEATPPRPMKSNCDPNYSGCVPMASDVDCAGGRGNGPVYVRGPIRVTGDDVYDLDRDGDGIACEDN